MLKRQSVLLIESNELDLFIERRILERNNVAQLSTFSSASSAIEHLMVTDKIYHLIIIHLTMVDANGLEFVDKLRSLNIDKKHGKICVISCSVDPRERMAVIEKKLGFMSKPLTIEKLKEL